MLDNGLKTQKTHSFFLSTPVTVLQDGFSDFVSRCEGADFEDANMAHQGKMSARDLQKMKQNPGLAYATKPASELAMDNREVWQVHIFF